MASYVATMNAPKNAMFPDDQPAADHQAGRLGVADEARCFDTLDLARLEAATREWSNASPRADVRRSRRRLLLLFMLLRHTGARSGELVGLGQEALADLAAGMVHLGEPPRQVALGRAVADEAHVLFAECLEQGEQHPLDVDAAHVRRKLYACARMAGLEPALAAPSALRRARAVELLRSGTPLPVVQRMLGHAAATQTGSWVAVDDEDQRALMALALERERRRSSARNAFYGRVVSIQRGDVQSLVRLQTASGIDVAVMITNDSLASMGLRLGTLATAEVKAPWVMLMTGGEQPKGTAGNCYAAQLDKLTVGEVAAEAVALLHDGTAICAVLAASTARELDLRQGMDVWVVVSVYAVVLHAG